MVKKDELVNMSKSEKKNFLSMDLAERMIRVEQTVSASFGKYIPYKETEYYKSMTSSQRDNFEKFLKGKKIKKAASILALVLPLFFIAFFNITFTGNAIRDNLGGSSYNFLFSGLIILVVIVGIIMIYSYVHKKNREENLKGHLKVLDDILVKKGTIKNKR